MITALIVNYNSTKFVELSLYALNLLTRNSIKVLICDNGSTYIEKQRLRKIVKKYKNITLCYRKQSKRGSVGHAEALDYLMTQVDTPYTVILDADAVFLKKNWDILLINGLNERVKIIGAPPGINPCKPTDFPLMYAVLFETETFRALNISFMARDIIKGLDTGWEMKEKYQERGYKAVCFDAKNTRYYKKGPFKNLFCVEYYYPNNNLIASHFGRGSTQGRNKYKRDVDKVFTIPIINRIYPYIRGVIEKELWIKICKNIIQHELRNIN